MQHLLRREETLDTTQLGDLAEQPQRAARLVLAAAANGEIEAQALLGRILLEGYGIRPIRRWPDLVRHRRRARTCHGLQHGRALPRTRLGLHSRYEARRRLLPPRRRSGAGLGHVQPRQPAGHRTWRGEGPHDRLPALSSGCRAWSCQVDEPHRPLPRRRLRRGQDVTAAHAWYARSAEAGDFRGQFSHAAVLLAQGQWEQARGWLERALRLGHLRFIETALASLRAAELSPIADIVEAYARRRDELRAGAR